jgi:hypothetical protein
MANRSVLGYLKPYQQYWNTLTEQEIEGGFGSPWYNLPDIVRAFFSFNPAKSPFPELAPGAQLRPQDFIAGSERRPTYNLARLQDGLAWVEKSPDALANIGRAALDNREDPAYYLIKFLLGIFEYPVHMQVVMEPNDGPAIRSEKQQRERELAVKRQDFANYLATQTSPNFSEVIKKFIEPKEIVNAPRVATLGGESITLRDVFQLSKIDWFRLPELYKQSDLRSKIAPRLFELVANKTNFGEILRNQKLILGRRNPEFLKWKKDSENFKTREIEESILNNIDQFLPYKELILLYVKQTGRRTTPWSLLLSRADVGALQSTGNLEELLQDPFSRDLWAPIPSLKNGRNLVTRNNLIAIYAVAGHGYKFAPQLMLYFNPDQEPVVMEFWSEFGESISILQDLSKAFFTWYKALPRWKQLNPRYWEGEELDPNGDPFIEAFTHMNMDVPAEETAAISRLFRPVPVRPGEQPPAVTYQDALVCDQLGSRLADEEVILNVRMQLRRLQDLAVVQRVPLKFLFETQLAMTPFYDSEIDVTTGAFPELQLYNTPPNTLAELALYSRQLIDIANNGLVSSLWWFDSLRIWWDSICKSTMDANVRRIVENRMIEDLGTTESDKADTILKNALRSVASGTSVAAALKGIQLAGRNTRAAYPVNPIQQDLQNRNPRLNRAYVKAVSNKFKAMTADRDVMKNLQLLYQGVMSGTTTELEADWDLQTMMDDFQ